MFQLNKYWHKLALLAFGHGLNDFVAGYMLGNLLYLNVNISSVITCFFIYNLLAFGGQYFAAILLNRVQNKKRIITFAGALNVLAIVIFNINPLIALTIAGVASAVYHITGGSLCVEGNKASGIGFFAAPGIAGLALAGYLAYSHVDVWNLLLVISAIFIITIQFLGIQKITFNQQHQVEKFGVDNHDILMIFLLGIIALRSAVWNIFQIVHEQNWVWLLAIALSAFIGKLFGGWLSDKFGWKLYSFFSIITALPLVTFFKEELILFCIGIGILQSAIPANTAMMINYWSGNREKGIAFSLGIPVFAGLIITAPVKLFSPVLMVFILLAVLLFLSLFLFRKQDVLKITRINLFTTPAKGRVF